MTVVPESISRLVFVVGCQRSGTTLTGQILGAHPNAILLDEGDGVYEWFELIAESSATSGTSQLATIFLNADAKYSSEEKRIYVDSGVPKIRKSVTHVILKAPNLTHRYSEISQLGIPADIVFLIRDPRSVVSSMTRLSHIPMIRNQTNFLIGNVEAMKGFSPERDLLLSAETPDHIKRAIIWKIKTSLYRNFFGARLSTLILQYEKLIHQKYSEISRLARHCKLGLHPKMLNHQDAYVGYGPGGTDRTRAIDYRSELRWKNMDANEVNDIIAIAEDLFSRVGYK